MAAEPKTLGRYQLGRVLGKGAMGSVCEALDPKLHRKVAIKTILMGQLDEETAKDFSIRFEREARAVARLNHPNIVQVYDFGEEGDTAYLVMELIDGKELKSALTTGRPFDRKECVRIMCELLDALDFAHEAKVIHRDIKPANVMFDSQGRTKLTDFGVARVTDADRTSTERTQAAPAGRTTPRLAARRPCFDGQSSGGTASRRDGARILALDQGQRRRERLRALRAAVSPRCLCVARGAQGRQAAQRLPCRRQRRPHHGGSRQDAGAEERPGRRSRALGEARSRRE